jgi:hypothetical protein
MFIKAVLRTIVAISLLVSFLSFPTSNALAATCSGPGCTGTDPVATGCAGNVTVLSSARLWIYYTPSGTWGKVDLMYSNTCKTKWARVTSYNIKVQPDGEAVNWDYAFMKKVGLAGGYYQKKGHTTTIYTNQVYAPGVSWQACGSLGEIGYSSDPIICTGGSTK